MAGAIITRITLPVQDLERATTFYGRLLHQPGRRCSPEAHEFSCGQTRLAIRQVADAAARTEPVEFAVPDLENHHGRAATSGCRGIGAIETGPDGARAFLVQDPSGNLLRFFERS